MIAKRILILLLIWLIPLYPVLAGMAVHQPAPAQAAQISQATDMHTGHDCCTPGQSADHTQQFDNGCDSGRCISHCAVSLLDAGVTTPIQIAFSHTLLSITPLSSITLETPLRPPLTL